MKTMSTTQEKIAVMQAFIEGKTIQVYYNRGPDPHWVDRDCGSSPSWNWFDYDYRIKREPREWWLVKGSGGLLLTAYPCKQNGFENIHVREVLE